jgi:hypothetical protein
MDDSAVTVSVRQYIGEVVEDRPWTAAPVRLLASAAPWRTFRWYKGQRHYSGTYRSATTSGHVIYESRLELARLLSADFDPFVHGITAQPFLLKAVVDGQVRKHIPDYLLATEQSPVVVDVKPRRSLAESVVASTFEWTRRAVESRGWRYEVWSESPETELENIRFLAGYRRRQLFAPELLDELRHVDLDGIPLRQAAQLLPDRPESLVRAATFHLLWTHDLRTDLSHPLRPTAVLRRAA